MNISNLLMFESRLPLMNEQDFLKRINLLEFHQKLLLKLVSNPQLEFYKLIVEKGISEQDVQRFLRNCDDLNNKMAEQKAEGFVHFHPLLNEFSLSLPSNLQVKEVIQACIGQNIFEEMMSEFQNSL